MRESGRELLKSLQALSNQARLDILELLKNPKENFPPQKAGPVEEIGVCVSHIQEKTGLSQSTVSAYLSVLEDAELVTSRRIGQWTHWKRNEKRIREISSLVRKL
jgi:ArsR family transcriptional regulator